MYCETIDDAKKNLNGLPSKMLSNPAFMYELEKTVGAITNGFYVEISGNRLIITENQSLVNRNEPVSYDQEKHFDISDRRIGVDSFVEYQYLTVKNHTISIDKDDSLIVYHQGATMSRNMEFYNQQSDLKYGLSFSKYDKNGIEMSHAFYTDSDQITSGRGDKSFDASRLCREISGRIPTVSYNGSSVNVTPGKGSSDANVQIFSRTSLGLVSVNRTHFSVTHGTSEKIGDEELYFVKSENPGLIDTEDLSPINKNAKNSVELQQMAQQNMIESTGYGSDAIKQQLFSMYQVADGSKVM